MQTTQLTTHGLGPNDRIDGHIDALFALALFGSGDAQVAQDMVVAAFDSLCTESASVSDGQPRPWRKLADHVHAAQLVRAHDPIVTSDPFRGPALTSLQREALALIAAGQDFATVASLLDVPASQILGDLTSTLTTIHASIRSNDVSVKS